MDKLELRHKLLYQDVLPALSPVVRAVLSPAGAVSPSALAKLLRLEPELVTEMRREVAHAGYPTTSHDVADVLSHLSRPQVRFLVFRHFLKTLLLSSGHEAEVETWHRAEKRARYAGVLAEATGESLLVDDGPLAALVLELGRVALDRGLDGAYGDHVQLAFAKGPQVLEAEQRALGVDHTLAGKWAATRWNLPQPVVDVIWFRHHAPHLLDLVQDTPELTHLVVLADLMVQEGNAFLSEDVRDRLTRLGLEESEVQAALTQESVRWNAREISDPARFESAPSSLREDLTGLQFSLRRAERLTHFYSSLLEANAPREVLHVFMNALAEDMAVAAASSAFLESEEAEPYGLAFTETAPEVTALSFAGAEDDPLGRATDALASSHETGTLISLPLHLAGGSRGQVALSVREGGLDEVLAEVRPLCAAVEAALVRCVRQERAESRAEAMATALWRQEVVSGKSVRSDRLHSLADVAAGAAHEINNPLAIVSGRAQMLLNHVSSHEDAKALDVIIQQSRRASNVLTELLQFARPSEPRTKECSLNFLLHQTVVAVQPRLEAMGIQIEEQYEEDLPKVAVDRGQMSRVLEHVVRNAEFAMTSKGGTLGIRIKASADGKSVVIQISDTGRGIPAEHLDRVFEPFYKVTENRANGGTGLGLAVCHGIVEMHRGTISLQSTPGEGSTCTITLPALANTTVDPIETRAPVVEPRRKTAEPAALVVVAEPDEALRAVLRESLEGQGYAVRCFSDSLEALATLLSDPVALLICHHPMRTTGGENLLEQARARRMHLPIIALGSGDDGNVHASDLGPDTHFLPKPFSLEALLRRVRALVPQAVMAAGA